MRRPPPSSSQEDQPSRLPSPLPTGVSHHWSTRQDRYARFPPRGTRRTAYRLFPSRRIPGSFVRVYQRTRLALWCQRRTILISYLRQDRTSTQSPVSTEARSATTGRVVLRRRQSSVGPSRTLLSIRTLNLKLWASQKATSSEFNPKSICVLTPLFFRDRRTQNIRCSLDTIREGSRLRQPLRQPFRNVGLCSHNFIIVKFSKHNFQAPSPIVLPVYPEQHPHIANIQHNRTARTPIVPCSSILTVQVESSTPPTSFQTCKTSSFSLPENSSGPDRPTRCFDLSLRIDPFSSQEDRRGNLRSERQGTFRSFRQAHVEVSERLDRVSLPIDQLLRPCRTPSLFEQFELEHSARLIKKTAKAFIPSKQHGTLVLSERDVSSFFPNDSVLSPCLNGSTSRSF